MKKMIIFILLSIFISTALFPDSIDGSRKNAIVTASNKTSLAVVNIKIVKTRVYVTSPFVNPFYDEFFDNFFKDFYPHYKYKHKKEIAGMGSGFIFSRDGYIITNSHVVEGAEQIFVTLSDEREFEAQLIGIDYHTDLAVIKINGSNLPHLQFGNSDDLMIGEWSIAVGNPFGNMIGDSKPTVTVGVISAINRNFVSSTQDSKVYKNMIQTDAAINPGNSGGPLVNCLGEVIGVNTFILTKSGGSLGIGFAIPSNKVRKIASELIKYGKIRDVAVGVRVQEMNPNIRKAMGIDVNYGILITTVDKNSPAYNAGIRPEDVLIEIEGFMINNSEDAAVALSDALVGDNVKFTIYRNNRELDISVRLIQAQ